MTHACGWNKARSEHMQGEHASFLPHAKIAEEMT